MTFLPIVARELRVAARRRGTYWTRLGAALAGLAVGAWVMLIPELRSPQRLGIYLFVALSVIAFVHALLAGLFTTADCLSEEKREGTLGLLFLTDLKGYDIVLGKLAATSLNSLYGMLAIFPVMAISLLAGGVTGAEFWRVVLVSVNNLFFSLAVGMFCSAVSKDERKAILLAFLIVISFTLGLPLIGAILETHRHWNGNPPALFFILSPGFACVSAFDDNYRAIQASKFDHFHHSVLAVHLMTWALLLASWSIVPKTWQDRAESPGRTRSRERWLRWAHGSALTRLEMRRRLLALNPFYWLAGRDRMKAILVWLFLGAGASLWSWGLWRYPSDWRDNGYYVCTALIAHTVLKLWVATEACRRFGADRKSGAFELLLSTPLTVGEIIGGQLLALVKQFAAPAAVVLLADFIFLMAGRNETDWTVIWTAGMIVFVADLITLSWVGMWTGLSSGATARATGAVVARVLVLPWMIFGLLMTAAALAPNSSQRVANSVSSEQLVVICWIVISLLNDFFLGLWARQRLLGQFRLVAAQPFEQRRGRKKTLKAMTNS